MLARGFEADIAVVGGGPAGSVAARRLAMLGYDVALVHEPRPGDRIEILPPTLSLLGHEVLTSDRLASIGEPVRRVRSAWTGNGITARDNPGTSMVQRSSFDRALLIEAARTGAVVLSPARAGAAQRSAGHWVVPVVRGGTGIDVTARFLIDARGRRGGRRVHGGPRTVALSARWTEAPLVPGDMQIAAHPEGWCWTAAFPTGDADVAVFVDTQACAGLGIAKLRQRYLAMLEQTPLFAELPGKGMMGPLSVFDATASRAEQPASARHLAVGDAALAIDPLSSHGVVVACRAAIHAAAVVHTILSGNDPAPALDFYAGRLGAIASQHALAAGAFYGEHETWRDRPFWRERIGSTELPGHAAPLRSSPASPDAPLILSPEAQTARVPALIGDKIELRDAITHPNLPEPIVRLGRYDLPALVARLKSGGPAAVLVARLEETCPSAEAWGVVDWLAQMGILERQTR